jgi:hypothetical protein
LPFGPSLASVGTNCYQQSRALYAGGAFASGIAGTAEAPIWIGGIAGTERPVLSGGANAIQLSSPSYVIVHDLEVTGQDSNGLNIDDGSDYPNGAAHHLIFRGLVIHDIGSGGNQDCLKLTGVDDFLVTGSEFRDCSAGSAIDHVGCHRGIIARNTFVGLGGNGVQSKGGSDDIEITQNRFLDAGERAVNMGGSTGFEFFRPAPFDERGELRSANIPSHSSAASTARQRTTPSSIRCSGSRASSKKRPPRRSTRSHQPRADDFRTTPSWARPGLISERIGAV